VIQAPRRRVLSRPHVRIPRLRRRGLIALAVALAVLAGAFLWVRQSSLVAVRKVTITGVTGPDASQIRAALRSAGLGMSTLHLDRARLHRVVAAYPVVNGLMIHTHFPHGLRIDVAEQIPVAVIEAGGTRTIVSADGALLTHPHTTIALPAIELPAAPGGTHLSGPGEAQVRLLAAAPYPLLAKVASAGRSPAHGLAVTLRDGPAVFFGDASDLAAKWHSVVAVLSDPSSAGASYIDVTDPARPAAGSGADTNPTAATTGDQTETSTSTTG
jgi:cell division protein FtsQ